MVNMLGITAISFTIALPWVLLIMGIKSSIVQCTFLYISYINESTNFAESLGGSGDTKDWGHEKDEDKIEWIRRCLRQATKMVKPIIKGD